MAQKTRFWGASIILLLLLGSFLAGGIIGKLQLLSPLAKIINNTETYIRSILHVSRGNTSNQRFIETGLLEVKLTSVDVFPESSGDKVGFSSIINGVDGEKDKFLIANRSGDIFYSTIKWPSAVTVQKLGITIPVEKNRFLKHPINKKHPDFPIQFGVKDFYVFQQDDKTHIFASHHYLVKESECVVMRVSYLKIDTRLIEDSVVDNWKTIYESSPCLLLDSKVNSIGQDNTFIRAGGRIARFDNNQVLVTIGDHYMDGIHNDNLVQNVEASYGKTVLINYKTSDWRVFTEGHRNPQGLFIDKSQNIWLSEHGPNGGDELNLLVENRNYGWPEVNYGTLDGYEYPAGNDWSKGGHREFQDASYVWVPSIASSNLIRLDDSNFSRWGDDLILTALGGKAIYRLITNSTTILGAEEIKIGERIRDVSQTGDGNILLMTDSGTFIRIEPATQRGGKLDNVTKGKDLWGSCASCHKITNDNEHYIGPNLYNILNRPIAAFDDFDYSEAMSSKHGVWTKENLDAFLKSPQDFVPGTTMSILGIEDDIKRGELIDYLTSDKQRH